MSMTRDQMVHYLNDQAPLNERTLGELREILDEYPYFQTAHLLYLRNLQIESNFRFASQLKTGAVYASDRTVLYHLLNSGLEKSGIGDHPLEIDNDSKPEGFSMIEFRDPSSEQTTAIPDPVTFVDRHHEYGQSDLLNFELSEGSGPTERDGYVPEKSVSEIGEESDKPATKRKKGKASVQKSELIDRFIKDNPAFTVKQPENSAAAEKLGNQIDMIGESDEFITETLARIYMNQGLYQKAIKSFEKLSLKYPEKSVYFARQIEEVTKLINK